MIVIFCVDIVFFANDNKIDRNHQKKYMSWEIAKKSIDIFFDHSKDSSEVAFSFYGGEPLLNFELIKKAVLYIDEKFKLKKIKYFMTTNGSLLNDEMITFLVNYNFNLMISEDGPESMQNYHRKYRYNGEETFATVLKNIFKIRKYSESFFENNVIFNPVLFANEDFNIVLDFFNSIGISKEKVRRQYADVSGVDYLYTGFVQDFNGKSINAFVSEYKKIQMDNFSKNVSKKTLLSSKWHHNGVCIPGVSKLFVTVDGNYYPCEKCIENSALRIGNVNDYLNVEKIRTMANIGKLTEEQCKTCWAMRFCKLCVIHCVDVEKDCLSSGVKSINCDNQKKLIEKYLKSFL